MNTAQTLTFRKIATLTLGWTLIGFALLACVLLLCCGVDLESINTNPQEAFIFWQNRVPRTIVALVAGGALALSGVLFQAVLRNPLAEPYILGVSAGAALGKIAFQMMFATAALVTISWAHLVASQLFVFVGAMIPTAFILVLLLRKRQLSPTGVLLSGLMINTLLMSLIMLIQFLADLTSIRQMQIWWLGNVDTLGYEILIPVLPIVLLCWAVCFRLSRKMNILSLDFDSAKQLGISPQTTSLQLLVLASILSAAAVSLAGPIAFVGLIVPHFLRLIWGADNRILTALAVPAGAFFLAFSDIIGSNATRWASMFSANYSYQFDIPVGIVTSFIGAPLFLLLLLGRKDCNRQ